MMKGKPTPKIQRRAAGLQITADLAPRPDAGINLASDIFRAVKADNDSKMQSDNQTDLANLTNQISNSPKSVDLMPAKDLTLLNSNSLPQNVLPTKTKLATDADDGAAVKVSEGQIRVVSLTPPKLRKLNKQPKKLLQIRTDSAAAEKIPTLFERTKAEELYELLHQLTLGAGEPCASVRVRRSDLMASTNIKTRLTLDLNLKRLEENDLLKIESRPGEQEGNIYTVYPLPVNSDKH